MKFLFKVVDFVTKPLKINFMFFMVVFLSETIMEGCADILSESRAPIRIILTCIRGLVDGYLFTVILYLIPRKIQIVFKVLVYFLMFLYYVIKGVALFQFNCVSNEDIISIILGTNPSEMTEFFETYVSFQTFLIFCSWGIILFFLFKSQIWIYRYSRKLSIILIAFIIPSIALNAYVDRNAIGVFFRCIYTFRNTVKIPDLKDFYQNAQVKRIGSQPDNIVLIIGESFSKSHSSLYGYEKMTNPKLQVKKNDSLLITYNNVTSDALHTIEAFQTMMSTYRLEMKDSVKWYKCLTIPELVQKAGYKSFWISNQSYKGFFENIPSRYAELCDSMIFVGDKFSGLNKSDYDEMVLSPLKDLPKDSSNFYFIHLMGSHEKFENRYPTKYNFFQPTCYEDKKLNQRNNLANYDNSILYNDYVVDSIIDLFSKKETLIIYLSDHALDIYESCDNYCGHASKGDAQSALAGSQIPFMVYMSRNFQTKYPLITNQLKRNTNKKYSSGDLIYTLIDIMGLEIDNISILNKQSILRN